MSKCLLFICFIFCTLYAKPPELEPGDVFSRLKTIMESHAQHKELNPTLVKRAIENYVELLDPGKTYFLASEVDAWLNPTDPTLNQALNGYAKGEFALFQTIHKTLLSAMTRRKSLEANIHELPQDVDFKEFKDIEWAKDEVELQERLAKLKALQVKISCKLSDDSEELICKRLISRRQKAEKRLRGKNRAEAEQIVLANVLKATAAALDSQTAYFTPDEASDFTILLQQRLFGIGVQLSDQLSGFEIVRVLEKGPAKREGSLKNGDLIIAVNGESVIGLDIRDVVRNIRGKAFTPVKLTILRGSEQHEVEIFRDEVVLEEARFESSLKPFGDGVIASIALHTFYQDARHSSSGDLKKRINKMKERYNIKGLLLDLRHNGGGLLSEAVAVTGLFITKGIVVSVKDEKGKVQHLRDTSAQMVWDGPLVVLVSSATASAAEIVAGTLQDYGRAIIVGDEVTYGKGTFQVPTIGMIGDSKPDPKGEHKVTRGTYYTVSGQSPQLIGIQSDIIAPSLLSKLEIGERFSKFPLNTDQIAPNFEDKLSDIPVFYRRQARETYLFDLQEQLTTYLPYIDQLKENSNDRITNNTDYQNFLEEEPSGSNDHQYQEGLNVMKDLLFLLQAA